LSSSLQTGPIHGANDILGFDLLSNPIRRVEDTETDASQAISGGETVGYRFSNEQWVASDMAINANDWFYWAVLSAVFAALTAIFAKIGLEGVDSDLATLVRTFVILIVLGGFVVTVGKWTNPFTLSPKTLLFLALSGLATGGSWVCYFRALKVGLASKVAPVDKLSLVLVAVFAVIFLHERPAIKEWIGILMIAAGVLILSFKR
jgi:transporter family protein